MHKPQQIAELDELEESSSCIALDGFGVIYLVTLLPEFRDGKVTDIES
jgi:hypothetical protein